jgi:hypothetical protein
MKNDFMKEIKEITNQYNFDDSNLRTDYSHVNFYVNIIFDYSITDKFKDNLKEVA